MPAVLSRWTMPILRISMGVFLVTWGVDKLIATEGAEGIFSNFYGVDAGALLVQVAGVLEIGLGVALAVGLFRVGMAWIALIVNAVSTFASWRQILDPWGVLGIGPGGSHLFLASIVIMAANVVLVLNAADETATLDARLRRGSADRGEAARARQAELR
ncbi:MAG: DoxX family protein [Gemmatimonadota bacterium]